MNENCIEILNSILGIIGKDGDFSVTILCDAVAATHNNTTDITITDYLLEREFAERTNAERTNNDANILSISPWQSPNLKLTKNGKKLKDLGSIEKYNDFLKSEGDLIQIERKEKELATRILVANLEREEKLLPIIIDTNKDIRKTNENIRKTNNFLKFVFALTAIFTLAQLGVSIWSNIISLDNHSREKTIEQQTIEIKKLNIQLSKVDSLRKIH